jgi:hypothetical protein
MPPAGGGPYDRRRRHRGGAGRHFGAGPARRHPLVDPGPGCKDGISHQTAAEIWKAFGLKPWRQGSFRVSPDPDLVDKIRDLVGLYMSPPVAAAVFAVDEKPQIQALNRAAPTLPMLPTTPQRATHDYERNGTCDLFAALDVATGTVITDIRPGTQARTSGLSCTSSTETSPQISTCTSSWTTFRPTRPPRSRNGYCASAVFTSTSRRPTGRG